MYALRMFYLARGIEDDHYWVAQKLEGVLFETPWRVEREWNWCVLSHADDSTATNRVFALGEFQSPESAEVRLRSFLTNRQ